MNPLFPCDDGAATHYSCVMHDTGRGTLCKNASDPGGRLDAVEGVACLPAWNLANCEYLVDAEVVGVVDYVVDQMSTAPG